jgi:regulator of protease activity HflC (stomatin/prohibitin superfamily)
MTSFLTLAFVGIVLIVIAAKSVVLTKPHERAVVFRLGKFLAAYPAGMALVMPFLDKVVKIRVEQIAGWERLSEEQLLERISAIYRSE